jgi:protein ImuA
MTASSAPAPETLHPSLWRASQLARADVRSIDTGHVALSGQLPGGGWPVGTLIDVLVQQPGSGEIRLLAPALASVAKRSIVMVEPPQAPQAIALASLGLAPSQLIWIRAPRSADALWSVEQVLKSGACGAVLFWQPHIRAESLRRLHLAAQQGETLFFMFRPLSAAQDTSPAPLRLSLRPAQGGIEIGFVKRRGPQRDEPLFLPMSIPTMTPNTPSRPALVPRPVPRPAVTADRAGELVR